MNAFPFTNADWDRVKNAAHPVLEATLADDDAVSDSMFIGLRETLQELRRKYGEHPVLLETEADFCSDPDDSIRLYAEALSIAQKHSLPTVSICLSYARALIDNNRSVNDAIAVLNSCHEQVYASRDEADPEKYEELVALLASRNRGTMR